MDLAGLRLSTGPRSGHIENLHERPVNACRSGEQSNNDRAWWIVQRSALARTTVGCPIGTTATVSTPSHLFGNAIVIPAGLCDALRDRS